MQADHTGEEILGRLLVTDFDSSCTPPLPGTVVRIYSTKPNSPQDVFTFTTAGYEPEFSEEQARTDVEAINVFPNPYNELFRAEGGADNRFVTFSHLPQKAVVRIFTLAGDLVKKIEKNEVGQFLRWNLLNKANRIVASGIYLVHIDMPELQREKVLKLIVVLR